MTWFATSLDDRVVLVTGGSAGIGRATVRRLAAAGARVVTCARHGDRLAEALAGVPRTTGLVADVAAARDRGGLGGRGLGEHGRPDAVVPHARRGWARAGGGQPDGG